MNRTYSCIPVFGMKSVMAFVFGAFILLMDISAREVYELDLETSILLARERSRTMKVLRLRVEGAASSMKATVSSFKTHIDMDLTIPRYSETIRQFEDASGISFYSIKQNTMSGTLNITQPLPSDGSLYVRTGVQSAIDYNANDRNAQITSSIGLRQPIGAFFGYNNYIQGYKQARLNYDYSLKQLKREELNLVYSVSQQFYNLLSSRERQEIARMTLDRQKEAFDLAQSKYSAGLIRESDALQMEVDYARASNEMDITLVNFSALMNEFKESLGLDLSDSIVIKGDLSYDVVTVDVERAVELALENRLELKESEIQIELQQMEVRRRKAQAMVSGNIVVDYNFMGVDKSDRHDPVRTSFENSWDNLIDRKGSLGVALTVNIPILDWGESRARIRSAELSLAQNLLQQEGQIISIERDMRTSVDRLNSGLRRFELLEKSVAVAEKSFEITRQRYANGDIDSQSMALERERLNNAYISRLESYISYKMMLSDIMRKTFYDFERNRSLLDTY